MAVMCSIAVGLGLWWFVAVVGDVMLVIVVWLVFSFGCALIVVGEVTNWLVGMIGCSVVPVAV